MVFGVQLVPSVLGGGDFSCPSCRRQVLYEHTETRRWFAIGVPLVPLQRLGAWIRCTECESTHDLDVLERPADDSTLFRSAVLRAGA